LKSATGVNKRIEFLKRAITKEKVPICGNRVLKTTSP
jgi:oligoribonuclease (3'-5' exoribonuclease)